MEETKQQNASVLHIPASLIVALVLAAGFLGLVYATASMLPEQVASHFGASGAADGWMSRQGYIRSMFLFGLGVPAFIAVTTYLGMLLPDTFVNLPHKEYWLSPAMRDKTRRYIKSQVFWMSNLLILLAASMHCLTIVANRHDPPQLPMTGSLIAVGGYVLGMAVWIIRFFRHFNNP